MFESIDRESVLAWLDQHHLQCDVIALSILAATVYRNWLWRVVCIGASYAAFVAVPGVEPLPMWGFALLALALHNVPALRLFPYFREQPEKGCVFITGADSGMGEATVLHLSKGTGYEILYAGCFLEESFDNLKAKVKSAGGDVTKVVPVKLDVTSDESVAAAAATVKADLAAKKPSTGLIGVINCAGMGFNGPAEYFPMDMCKRQMDVNFFGYVRVTQQFMPLLKAAVAAPGARRARCVYIGTGGGILSPGPPLLSAYMASKWAIEAFCRSIRVEMQLRELPIDCCMVNPGFVKPTMLMSEGLKLNARMWEACAKSLGSNVVRASAARVGLGRRARAPSGAPRLID
jgi:NAD(P)-dependent dehydrogenase (short-subunit alcohol dehydrogenase family)